MLLEFVKFKNAVKSREVDPKRRYSRHPVYGYNCVICVYVKKYNIVKITACI